jgi:hypothetical protein
MAPPKLEKVVDNGESYLDIVKKGIGFSVLVFCNIWKYMHALMRVKMAICNSQ